MQDVQEMFSDVWQETSRVPWAKHLGAQPKKSSRRVWSCETVRVLDEGGMVDSMKWAVFWFLFVKIFSASHL